MMASDYDQYNQYLMSSWWTRDDHGGGHGRKFLARKFLSDVHKVERSLCHTHVAEGVLV